MNNTFSDIVQTGVIVSDAAATVDRLNRVLGWQPVCSRETMRIPGRTYRGQDEDFACLMYFYQFSQIELEIIQPLCGKSCWNDYYVRNGNGIHHLLFDLTDSASALEQLSAHGIQIEQRGRALPYGEHAFWAYVSSHRQLGFTMELTNRSEAPQPALPAAPAQGLFSNLKGVSISVQNLEASIKAYRTILGWAPSGSVYRIQSDRYRGKEASALSGAIAYSLPNLAIELVRPAFGTGSAREQLADYGEGLFCINFNVYGPEAALCLADHGVSILEQGHTIVDRQALRWTLFDTKSIFGFHLRALYP